MKKLFFSENKCFIIAEISANHRQKFAEAVSLIKMAKKCGCDAVKFQVYTPDMLTIDSCNKCFKIHHNQWGGQTLYQLYKKAYTPWEWFSRLKNVADECGIIFFATAFDKSSVDMLENLNVPLHKIASFELVDLPLIKYIASTKKPLILSTGMADLSEIKEAYSLASNSGSKEVAILKCVSSYPARPQEMNLRTIPDMKKRFKCVIGLSDHTLYPAVSVAAVSLGARIIEKHVTLSRKTRTPDSFFSLEPQELRNLVNAIRVCEQALGKINYGLTLGERKSRVFRRSLFVVKDMDKNEEFSLENVRAIRPANGIKPKYLNKVIGKKAAIFIRKGTPLSFGLIK